MTPVAHTVHMRQVGGDWPVAPQGHQGHHGTAHAALYLELVMR